MMGAHAQAPNQQVPHARLPACSPPLLHRSLQLYTAQLAGLLAAKNIRGTVTGACSGTWAMNRPLQNSCGALLPPLEALPPPTAQTHARTCSSVPPAAPTLTGVDDLKNGDFTFFYPSDIAESVTAAGLASGDEITSW